MVSTQTIAPHTRTGLASVAACVHYTTHQRKLILILNFFHETRPRFSCFFHVTGLTRWQF